MQRLTGKIARHDQRRHARYDADLKTRTTRVAWGRRGSSSELSKASGKSPLQFRAISLHKSGRRRRKSSRAEKFISRAISKLNDERSHHGGILHFRFYRNRALLRPSCLAERDVRASSRYVRRGCGGRVGSQRDLIMPTNDIDADVKSCGPGLPVLRPSWRQRSRVALATGAIEPVPGESTYKR
jgi:hypothetical protein